MRIEKLSKLKNGLYEVIVKEENKEHCFKLSEDLIIKNGLYKSKSLTKNEFEQMNELVNESKLYTSALNYISYKIRAEEEVRNYLKEKDCERNLLDKIIHKLKQLNYINDAIYSNAFTKHQFEINKKGPNLIKQELLKKKVDEKYIENSLNLIKQNDITTTVLSLIAYYDKMNKNKSLKKLKDTILRNLTTKGYDYEIIIEQMKQYPFASLDDETNILKQHLAKAYTKWVKKFQGHELKTKIIKTLINKGFNYDDILQAIDSFHMEG